MRFSEEIMGKAFGDVHDSAKRYKVDRRIGAYFLAVDRVAKAAESGGIWP